MEGTKWQTMQKTTTKKNLATYSYISAGKFDVQINQKYWNRDTGLLVMDYGSGTTGSIWTINSGMIFCFWAKLQS